MSEPAAEAGDPSPPHPPQDSDSTGVRNELAETDSTGAADESTPYTMVTIPPPKHLLLRALRFGWVPLIAAMLSLVLSIASIYVATRQPEVLLIMPNVVRLSGGHASGSSYLYLQPAFVSTGTNDRVEVITNMAVTVHSTSGGQPAELVWVEQVALVSDVNGLSYRHEADAVPLLVSPKSAAAPLSLFQAPSGWFFDAGTYDFTLTASRLTSSDPLRGTFSVTISPSEAVTLLAVPEQFLPYPI
ncbi:MAG: hypothetical protein LH650_16015 [Chloroflexi bacterium]|nr:hypothetical protein [Chloroflexota bacterium]